MEARGHKRKASEEEDTMGDAVVGEVLNHLPTSPPGEVHYPDLEDYPALDNPERALLSHQTDKALLEPYFFTERHKGKGIRKRLIEAFDLWMSIPPEKKRIISDVVNKLHNASLMIDDIEDSSRLRRGLPVAHAIYGIPTTLNAANYLYFLAMQACLKLDNARAMKVFTAEILNLHRGQGFDIFWRDNLVCPTEDEYKRMVSDKTGGLFRLGVQLMQAFSASKADYIPLVNALGLFYQILDDYLNLQSAEYMTNKSFCEDLTEGKFSFPIIHSIHATPDDHRLLNILKKHTEDVDVKKYAVHIMQETGSFEYTLRILTEIKKTIAEEIAKLGGNETLWKIVEDIDKQVKK